MLIKVEEDHSLVRDSITGAILNTNRTGLEEYKRKRNQKLSASEEITKLKGEVDGIKELLVQILDRLDKDNG